jgi:hypothetical protein
VYAGVYGQKKNPNLARFIAPFSSPSLAAAILKLNHNPAPVFRAAA